MRELVSGDVGEGGHATTICQARQELQRKFHARDLSLQEFESKCGMRDPVDHPKRLETILVTGASRGIGLALSKRLLQEEYRVIASYRSETPPETLSTLENGNHRGSLTLLRMDVSEESAISRARDLLSDQFDHLDVLVNNAGWMPEGASDSLEDLDLDSFSTAFAINVVAVARVTRALLPLLRRSRRARVLNLSSRAASIAMKENFNQYAYGTSKTALNMLTVTMANELRADHIAVTAVSPGWVRTRMGGPNASLEPHESAESLARLIPKLSMEYSGEFYDRDGEEKLPW